MTPLISEQIAAALRKRIRSGELAVGDELPSEATLAADNKCARGTVRQALNLLRGEGLVTSQVGRGWFVRESRPVRWNLLRPEHGNRGDAWAEDVREQGREPHEDLQASIMIAEPHMAELLELSERAEVWVRRRLRYVDGELTAVAATYFPFELVRDTEIARPRDVLPGTLAVLERLGHPVERNEDEIESRPAAAGEAELFGLRAGDSMLEVVRVRRGTDGRPVAVTITTAPGDKVIIVLKGADRDGNDASS